jgi:hypothetical protein
MVYDAYGFEFVCLNFDERCFEVKKSCQNCKHHSSGVAIILESGRTWNWQECTKNWGKPTPVGVIKNVCQLHKEKEEK